MQSEYEYFKVEVIPTKGKTNIYSIINKMDSSVHLGYIKWFGPWRKYCFYPTSGTVWDTKCLAGVVFFINELMAARKADKAHPKT